MGKPTGPAFLYTARAKLCSFRDVYFPKEQHRIVPHIPSAEEIMMTHFLPRECVGLGILN